MSASAAMLFFAMAAVGYTVTGIVGFGANLLMIPILSMFFPLEQLVLIFSLISFVNAIYRVYENRKGIIGRVLLPTMVTSLLGTTLGMWIFQILPEVRLKLLLGAFVLIMALYNLAGYWHTSDIKRLRPSRMRRLFYDVILFGAGFFQGSFVCGGPLYGIYCSHHYGNDKTCYRGMNFALISTNSILLVILNGQQGLYSCNLILPTALGLCGLIIAILVSRILMRHLKERTFYFLIQVVLLVSGVNLIIQSLDKFII